MPYIETVTAQKARQINNTPSIYGTFAEIGAGQEVVNHFFKAGQASQTVAKSMSAYDMNFSDEIYGPTDRYVSQTRLFKMLDHEYTLLQKRLKKKRGHDTRFFAFANTVATRTTGRFPHCGSQQHGWMGIRFQTAPNTPYNEIIVHLNLLDKTRLQQYETLGVLGVNLIYSAFYIEKKSKNIIKSLFDNFEANRVEIDVLKCSGKLFQKLNKQELNLELIRQNLTQAVLFQNQGENILPLDALYEKPVLVVRHSLAKNVQPLVNQALSYIKKQKKTHLSSVSSLPFVLLIDVPLADLKNKPIKYFIRKYSSILQLVEVGYILISHFKKWYELTQFIRTASDQSLFIILPSKILSTKKDESILNFFSKLCDSKTTLITCDYGSRHHPSHCRYLEKHLIATGQLVNLKFAD